MLRGAVHVREGREKMKKTDVSGRRNILKAAGAGIVAAAASPLQAGTLVDELQQTEHHPKPVYVHGCGWNHDLPGVFGELCLKFEARAELNGTGVGTFGDDVHPEVNSQFRIDSARRNGNVYTLEGVVTSSQDPGLVGLAVTIEARKTGHGTGSASITVGSQDKELVVIAIIAILIGLLLPAVQ
jgi:hypothetical protein